MTTEIEHVLQRLRAVEHFLIGAQNNEPTAGQAWALVELQRAIAELIEAAA